jgi:hypothetical protein
MRPERIAAQHALPAHRLGDSSVRLAGGYESNEFASIGAAAHASRATTLKISVKSPPCAFATPA